MFAIENGLGTNCQTLLVYLLKTFHTGGQTQPVKTSGIVGTFWKPHKIFEAIVQIIIVRYWSSCQKQDTVSSNCRCENI